jgi:hypothetical protein
VVAVVERRNCFCLLISESGLFPGKIILPEIPRRSALEVFLVVDQESCYEGVVLMPEMLRSLLPD